MTTFHACRLWHGLKACPFKSSSSLFDFGCQHHRRWSGDATVLSHPPEVNDHKNRSNDRNPNAMPDIGTQQGIRIHDRAAEQAEAHVVVGRHAQLFAKWTFMSQPRRGAGHIGAYRDRPESQLIVWKQVSGERKQ